MLQAKRLADYVLDRLFGTERAMFVVELFGHKAVVVFDVDVAWELEQNRMVLELLQKLGQVGDIY